MLKILWKMLFPAYAGKHYDTVRYAFPIVLITAFFAGLAAVVTEDNSYVTLKTEAGSVSMDQQFTIDVTATTHVPVNAVDLTISYPKDLMSIDGIDTGTSVITLWTVEPYAKDGNIYLRGGTFRKGFVGEHTIARIKAHATQAGEARVLIKETQLIAGDGLGSTVPVTKSDAYNETKIHISGANGVIAAKATISIVTDTDGDGDVDFRDISTFMASWFTQGNTYDFDGDGGMTFTDFSIILAEAFFR